MSTAAQIADLITAGMRGPIGPEDSAFHTGQIVTWDESSGVNTVLVNGVVLSNLQSVTSGVGVQYSSGDVVMVVRKQTQYFILGKVDAPGAALGNQIRYAEVSTQESTGSTSYTDLATVGPTISNVLIGSSRRFLLIVNCFIICSGTAANVHMGGSMTVNISGATTLNVVGTTSASWVGQTTPIMGGSGQFVRTFVLSAANGINPGLHTFQAKYNSMLASPTCGFRDRAITVIPF